MTSYMNTQMKSASASMEARVYVPDATTLVNNIHLIKQWLYEGTIRILVPICELAEVEELYRASIAPKGIPKEQSAKRSFGKPSRKEHPLFDINPRTAWEFICRAKSERGERGVSFQFEGQCFTQWEKAAEEVVRHESPPAAPTSFAEALLRKLNIAKESEGNEPAKPKLITRAGQPKSPWQHHKVPTIPVEQVPANLKQLMSCMLWRLHEFENDPLNPMSYGLLVDDTDIQNIGNIAKGLGIPVRDTSDLYVSLLEMSAASDHRVEKGLLETDFPEYSSSGHANLKSSLRSSLPPDPVANGHALLQIPLASNLENSSDNGTFVTPLNPSPTPAFATNSEAMPQSSTTPWTSKRQSTMAPIGTGRPKTGKDANAPEQREVLSAATSSLLDTLTQSSTVDPAPISYVTEPVRALESPVRMNGWPRSEIVESDIDSDEEVVVFNPRARRVSGRAKAKTGVPVTHPVDMSGHTHNPSDSLKPKSPMTSTLKPQSPVFTPGQVYAPANPVTCEDLNTLTKDHISVDSPKAGVSPKPSGSPARSPRTRSSTPRRPRADIPQRLSGNEALHRQSEMIIQRQREVIQRQVKAAAKPPPRQVQLEPTENPTVIDPNAFDRSYVVQQPTAEQTTTGVKPRSGGRGRRSPKDSPKRSPRQPATERSAAQTDTDFVLKSGTPRGSARGKGKLWIP